MKVISLASTFFCVLMLVAVEGASLPSANTGKSQGLSKDEVVEIAKVASKVAVAKRFDQQFRCTTDQYFARTGRCENCNLLCADNQNRKMCSLMCPVVYERIYFAQPIQDDVTKLSSASKWQESEVGKMNTSLQLMAERMKAMEADLLLYKTIVMGFGVGIGCAAAVVFIIATCWCLAKGGRTPFRQLSLSSLSKLKDPDNDDVEQQPMDSDSATSVQATSKTQKPDNADTPMSIQESNEKKYNQIPPANSHHDEITSYSGDTTSGNTPSGNTTKPYQSDETPPATTL